MCPYHSGWKVQSASVFFYLERYFVCNKSHYSLIFFPSGKQERKYILYKKSTVHPVHSAHIHRKWIFHRPSG